MQGNKIATEPEPNHCTSRARSRGGTWCRAAVEAGHVLEGAAAEDGLHASTTSRSSRYVSWLVSLQALSSCFLSRRRTSGRYAVRWKVVGNIRCKQGEAPHTCVHPEVEEVIVAPEQHPRARRLEHKLYVAADVDVTSVCREVPLVSLLAVLLHLCACVCVGVSRSVVGLQRNRTWCCRAATGFLRESNSSVLVGPSKTMKYGSQPPDCLIALCTTTLSSRTLRASGSLPESRPPCASRAS